MLGNSIFGLYPYNPSSSANIYSVRTLHSSRSEILSVTETINHQQKTNPFVIISRDAKYPILCRIKTQQNALRTPGSSLWGRHSDGVLRQSRKNKHLHPLRCAVVGVQWFLKPVISSAQLGLCFGVAHVSF